MKRVTSPKRTGSSCTSKTAQRKLPQKKEGGYSFTFILLVAAALGAVFFMGDGTDGTGNNASKNDNNGSLRGSDSTQTSIQDDHAVGSSSTELITEQQKGEVFNFLKNLDESEEEEEESEEEEEESEEEEASEEEEEASEEEKASEEEEASEEEKASEEEEAPKEEAPKEEEEEGPKEEEEAPKEGEATE